jgi:hypothetical protein
MSKGQYLSHHQQGIVKRYYDNQDTLIVTKLAELVSELYICDDEKKAASLWKSVQTALKKTSVDPLKAARIVNEKRKEDLAQVVQQLSAPGAKILAEKPRSAYGVAVAARNEQSPAPAAPAPEPITVQASALLSPSPASPSTPPPAVPAAAPTPEQLKGALTAFRKRLKLAHLNEESKLSSRALTGGRKSTIKAIQPPYEYPKACWDELVKQGKIRAAGSGLYELVE